MMKEFSLRNSTADIIRINEEKKQLEHYRDPWGRDSSSTPDQVYPLNTVLNNKELLQFLQSNMYPQDFVKLTEQLSVM